MLRNNFYINKPLLTNKNNKNQFYYLPHPSLRTFISHYTFTSKVVSSEEDDKQDIVVVPDASGCLVYILDERGFHQKCWGPTTKATKVSRHEDKDERAFFVEFNPGGFSAIFGLDCRELVDKQFHIADLNQRLANLLYNEISSSVSIADLIERVNNAFLKLLNTQVLHNTVIETMLNIHSFNGQKSVRQLAERVFTSERHLSRIFKRHTGLSVKKFSRIVRVNKTIKLFKTQDKQNQNSAILAQQLGFFDESHLIKDFKQLCDITPQSYLKNMAYYYNEPFKF